MKSYSRLSDFLEDGEEDVPLFFACSASLRIMGNNIPFADIENTLGLKGSHKHRRGESRGKKTYEEDLWTLSSPLPEEEPLAKHLDWLWEHLHQHINYLLSLKRDYKIDIFAGYRSNCDHAGIEIPVSSMRIYFDLEIPFGLSIIVA
ncbi:MAG TPA: DUF4279 domain-containing protein [Blastocatellia bacterium]|nr:DUF4279 domain-containing protein [Blastocatellia bacterium]